MTDYYPLLARAITGLEQSSGEARRALYERARNALLAQLRNADPPLSETEITRERLALEEAVRRVEAEAVRQKRAAPAAADQNAKPQPSPPARTEPDVPPAPRPPESRPGEAKDNGPSLPAQPPPRRQRPESQGAAPQRNRRVDLPYSDLTGPRPARSSGAAAAASALDQPADLDSLERAPEPVRSAKAEHQLNPVAGDTIETPEPGPEVAGSPLPKPPPRRRHPGPMPRQPVDLEPGGSKAARRGLIAALLTIFVLTSLGLGAYWQRETISGWFGASRAVPPPASRDQAQNRPKASDRVQQEGKGAQSQGTESKADSTSQPALVAQRVVLYEEDPNNPEGNRYVGSALWRTETVSPGPGMSPELAVRAEIEIPERRLGMTMSIRRNTDQALPASHTVEIIFNVPADFPFGGVANVPGLLMKEAEQARGAPLSGLAVKVTDGFFLIGLSAGEADRQRNMQLLKERGWFDIPMVYNNGRRAILAIEKGNPGERVFSEAFTAWSR